MNWTVIPARHRAWARLVYPDLEADAALERLWPRSGTSAGSTSPIRVDAWAARAEELRSTSRGGSTGSARRAPLRWAGDRARRWASFDGAQWQTARGETVDGIVHLANLPTEEVYTTPDPARDGGSRALDAAARPRRRADRPRARRAVRSGPGRRIDAEEGAEILRGRAALDEGAARLGEVALVDRESRIGRLGTTFHETLLDENAVSHIALGDGDPDVAAPEGDARA